MGVKIRLRRMGTNKKPHYRVVVADSRSPRDGMFLETLGFYDPMKEPPGIEIDRERARYWQERGAQLSDTVRQLLSRVEAHAAAEEAGE